ncbi:MAG: hypothetical protein DI624_04505 [Brevundimonas sp.]|uniref:pPIWI-associating nuclease domain-containing protein n=1 Tax=Brevundimonas sp. TaxID=1871086 RepID=UPI000DB2C3DB|nr:hypothetical protein [Brevundimonas sp.]PZT99695.1 MAG: hypothetical protein DI624_04505 [Brevundimonas sp.]
MWDKLTHKANEIKPHLPDDFSRLALDQALASAQTQGPLRGNFFAVAMREVTYMTLHAFAPDEPVMATPGFELVDGQNRPTQAQRLAYWARAGLDPTFVAERLQVELDQPVKTAKAALTELSKRVHFRETTQVGEEAEVVALVGSSFDAFAAMIDAAEATRSEVIEALAEEVNDEALNTFIFDTIDAIAEIASHYSIESVWVDHVAVHQQAPDRLRFVVEGSVSVGLQWGSNSDVRRGDGHQQDENFKFELQFTANTLTPTDFEDVIHRLDLGLWEQDYLEPEPERW